MVGSIASFMIEKILDILPGSMARLLISPQKIASRVEIDLRSANPIDISFGTEIPRLSLSFRISNMSLFDLVLDRLLIDLWVGQPTLRGAILERHKVLKRASTDNVYFTNQLTVPQPVPVTINVTAYFDSKIGAVDVQTRFERTEVPCK
jgi:hypothetical protein